MTHDEIIKHYEGLSPNAKMLGFRKLKQRLEEEMAKLETECTKCECGFLFDMNSVQCVCENIVVKKEVIFYDLAEFGEDEYGDAKYLDTVYYCPVCGKRHIKEHLYMGYVEEK